MRAWLPTVLTILGSVASIGCATSQPPERDLHPGDLSRRAGKYEGALQYGETLVGPIRVRIQEDGSYEMQTAWRERDATQSIPWRLSGYIRLTSEGATYEDSFSSGTIVARQHELRPLEWSGAAHRDASPVVIGIVPLEIGSYTYLPPAGVSDTDLVACREQADWEAKATAASQLNPKAEYGAFGVVGAIIDIARTSGELVVVDRVDADRIYERAIRKCLRNRGYPHAGEPYLLPSAGRLAALDASAQRRLS